MTFKELSAVNIDAVYHLGGMDVVDKFKKLVKGNIINPNLLRLVTIMYDKNAKLNEGLVRLYFHDGAAVYLNLIPGGTGVISLNICDILDYCHLQYDKNLITTPQQNDNMLILSTVTNSWYFTTMEKKEILVFNENEA